jgi:hypothetical protein
MDRTMEYCWRMAKEYTRRAEETTDKETQQFFYRTRDNLIRVATQQEVTAAIENAPKSVLCRDADGISPRS